MRFEIPRLDLEDILWLRNNVGPLETMAHNLIVGKGWQFDVEHSDNPDCENQIAFLTIEDGELASLFILVRR